MLILLVLDSVYERNKIEELVQYLSIYLFRLNFDCNGDCALGGGVLRTLLRFWKILGAEPIKRKYQWFSFCPSQKKKQNSISYLNEVSMVHVQYQVLDELNIQNFSKIPVMVVLLLYSSMYYYCFVLKIIKKKVNDNTRSYLYNTSIQ